MECSWGSAPSDILGALWELCGLPDLLLVKQVCTAWHRSALPAEHRQLLSSLTNVCFYASYENAEVPPRTGAETLRFLSGMPIRLTYNRSDWSRVSVVLPDG